MKKLFQANKHNPLRFDNIQRPHGTPEYKCWSMARNRCRNPRAENWKHYGGRGITFSPTFDDFKTFLFEVGPRPSLCHKLERIDNAKGYEPGNIRWATQTEQCNNRRSNRVIAWNGESHTLAEWGRKTGMGWAVIQSRLTTGWSLDRSMTQPVRRWPNAPRRQG